MAGDWIKMRVDLSDDPAVLLIASRIGSDEDSVVGKLHRLWSWADRHTIDGKTNGVTAAWVDRFVCCKGFSDAMAHAGWLVVHEDSIEFPGFERHNGASAKQRAGGAIRKRLSRQDRDKGETGLGRDLIPRPFVKAVLKRDGYQCVYCGTESNESREATRKALLSIDHLIPNTRGGKTVIENLVCACRKCNNEKGDRTPAEWDLHPSFLQPGVVYDADVTQVSHKKSDTTVTREEKRREEVETKGKKKRKAAVAAVVDYTPGFSRSWDAYKATFRGGKEKPEAFKAWCAAVEQILPRHGGDLEAAENWLHGRILSFIKSRDGSGQFAPLMATWLNADKFDEDDTAWNRADLPVARASPAGAATRELAQIHNGLFGGSQ